MALKREYKRIVESDKTKPATTINKNEFNEFEYNCLIAFESVSKKQDYKNANMLLEDVSLEECSSFGRALFKEVQLNLKLREVTELDQLIYLADEILELNPEAAFAKSFKGYVAIRLGNPKGGIDYYLEIVKDYPRAYWIYHQMVRVIYEFSNVKEARPFISSIRPRSVRSLYYAGNFFLSRRLNVLYFFLDFVLGLVTNSTTATLPFLGIPVFLTIFAFTKREIALFRKFLLIILQGIVVTFLISLN